MMRYIRQFCLVVAILFGLQHTAQAVQWQALRGTSRYKISYDEQSVRLTPFGRLELWLRFIPRGEAERKAAAVEYKEKRYFSHLEYYEVDCSEQTAILGLVDILSASRTRIKRLQVGGLPEPILSGSVLENATERICPTLDEETEESQESANPEPPEEPHPRGEDTISSDMKLQIESLQKKASSKDATADTWKELGNIYFDTDQPELSIKAYDRALALQPNDTDILNDQGAMFRQTGDFKRAVANFEKAYSIDPQNIESLYNSGFVYAFDLNNIPKALEIWRRYLEKDADSETARQVQSFIEKYGNKQ
jgi:tetratricopeptide (TPR) repeat protein